MSLKLESTNLDNVYLPMPIIESKLIFDPRCAPIKGLHGVLPFSPKIVARRTWPIIKLKHRISCCFLQFSNHFCEIFMDDVLTARIGAMGLSMLFLLQYGFGGLISCLCAYMVIILISTYLAVSMGISFALNLLRHGKLRAVKCGVRSSY